MLVGEDFFPCSLALPSGRRHRRDFCFSTRLKVRQIFAQICLPTTTVPASGRGLNGSRFRRFRLHIHQLNHFNRANYTYRRRQRCWTTMNEPDNGLMGKKEQLSKLDLALIAVQMDVWIWKRMIICFFYF